MKHYEDDTEDDTEPEVKRNTKVDLVSQPQEWGGWPGALLFILALPICSLLLQLACTNNYCSHKNFRIPRLKEWKLFLNLHAFLIYAVFLCFVAVISLLPIGRLVDGQQSKVGRLQYRMNGKSLFLSLIFINHLIYAYAYLMFEHF